MSSTTDQPGWVGWVTPVLGAMGAVGTVVAYIVRKLLIGIVKEELDKKHADNVQRFDRLETMLQQSREDRQKIHEEIQKLKEETSFERGYAAGSRHEES